VGKLRADGDERGEMNELYNRWKKIMKMTYFCKDTTAEDHHNEREITVPPE